MMTELAPQPGCLGDAHVRFIAGGADDPRHGYGLCLNCPIVHRGYHQ